MPGSADETGAAGYRPLLFSIAYGMTGSVGDAEDIVQDAFVGLTRARQAGTTIADPKAYLTTVVSRLGINYLSSARVRRETYVGDWLPEPVVVPAGGPGPAGRRAGRLAVHGVPCVAGGPLAGGAGGVGTAAARRRRSGSRWPGGSASCGCSSACSARAGSSAPGSGWPGSTASRAPCCTTPKGAWSAWSSSTWPTAWSGDPRCGQPRQAWSYRTGV